MAGDVTRGKVAVLGAGLMGAEIAALFLRAGHVVTVTVSARTSPEAARERVEAGLSGHDGRVLVAASAAEASLDADLVIESLPERPDVKHEHLRSAELAAPDALLATNTSSLSVTHVAEGLRDPSRLVGIHFLNPPSMFSVVEVVPGARTRPEHVTVAARWVRGIDKHPIVLKRDVPGFLINRIQMAVLRECLHLVDAGVASAEDIDLLMEAGLARRWTALGPFATASLGGAALFAEIARQVFPSLAHDTAPTDGVVRRAFTDAELDALRHSRRQVLETLRDTLGGRHG